MPSMFVHAVHVSPCSSQNSTLVPPSPFCYSSPPANAPEHKIAFEVNMPEGEFEYDVFLSHAGEDAAWCEQLAERLRNEGVRVWFDRWKIQPGHNITDQINQGLQKSRKLIAIWSEHYFADRKVWTLAESYATQHADVLGRERLLIPVLLSDCEIKPTLRGLLYVDFRNRHDFDLRVRQLIEALDLPTRDFVEDDPRILPEHKDDLRELGRIAHRKGKRFEDEVAALYRLLGFEVTQDTELSGIQIDLMIEKREGGLRTQAIVECKDKRIIAGERDQILAQQNLAQRLLPRFRWIALSSAGFAAQTRAALEGAGVDCTTYPELLRDLVPLENYVTEFIRDYETAVADPDKGWGGRDLFIRPDLETDITYEKRAALSHFAKWLGDDRSNLLVVLGDLGTGKTTLARFLAYQLARSFRDDPVRHPAPVFIPLREVRKEVALDSIVIKHFRDRGLTGLSFPRFEHLLRKGRIVLFFDAFDEMADRVRWEVTLGNFQELRRAAESGGKVILTCRTHYFKDRTEQLRLIGQGPSLTAAETALYKELRQQSNAEVVYLQEFSDEQIKAYLNKARGAAAEADWQKIETIYNLKDLAQRPLLLDMIVKSLPHLKTGEQVNAASLYTVYTNLWVDRDFRKGRVVLTPETKLGLMTELAWRMWTDEKNSFSIPQLTEFVTRLHAAKAFEFGDQEADDIAREVQAASFLRRDHRGERGGDFHFIHRSFGEFFLAKRILQALLHGVPPSGGPLRAILNTRRLDRKVIYFLTLLDEQDSLCAQLQQILTSPYAQNISENALQILYWSGRVRSGTEENIEGIEKLRECLAQRLPAGARLNGAKLEEVVLEAASFTNADFSGADLTKANFNQARFTQCRFKRANLRDARLEDVVVDDSDFAGADINGTAWGHAHYKARSVNEDENYEIFMHVIRNARWTGEFNASMPIQRERFQPVVQLGSLSAVNSLAWHKDRDLLAVGGSDGVIRLYRAVDGKLLRTFEGHDDSVLSVALDYGQTLASGGDDKTVRLWDAASGKLLRTLEGHEHSVQTVGFSPGGYCLASGSHDETVKLWETSSGQLIRTLRGHLYSVQSVVFDPTGKKLASGSHDGTVNLWDTGNGQLLRTLKENSSIRSVAFNPSGQSLASGGDDKTVNLWDAASGQLVRTLEGHEIPIVKVAFAPINQKLASASHDGIVKLWEATSGKLLRTLKGHSNSVRGLGFDSTGQMLASGSHDNTVKLWETDGGRLLRTIEGNQDAVWSLAFDPAGNTLASGSDDRVVKLWDTASGKLLRTLEGHKGLVSSVVFDPSGQLLVSSDDRVLKVWHPASGKLLRTFDGHVESVWSVAFDSTGRTLASGSQDKTVKLWDTASGKLLHTLAGHGHSVLSVAFDPTGERLISGSDDSTVRLWDAASGKLLRTLQGHRSWVLSVVFDPTGQTLASGSDDRVVKLWDTSSGSLLCTLEGHARWVTSLAFDPSSHVLASGSNDGTVKLWDTPSGKLLHTFKGHLGSVSTVAFAPKGRYLVAAGTAGRLQFWDVEKGEPFLYSYAFGHGGWLALLPDGRFDGTPEALRYLCYTEKGTFNSFTAGELQKEFYDPDAVREVLAKYVR